MHAYDYHAVVYDSEVYCTVCLPDGIDTEHPDVHPIFANSEWDSYPVCDHCHGEHDYVSLTSFGQHQRWLDQLPKDLREMVMDNGKLPAFAWPGGYPLVYLDHDNAELCADCASKLDWSDAKLTGYDIHYEGESICCENCNAEIESAYGPVEENDNE